jgi:hypothetical protein
VWKRQNEKDQKISKAIGIFTIAASSRFMLYLCAQKTAFQVLPDRFAHTWYFEADLRDIRYAYNAKNHIL